MRDLKAILPSSRPTPSTEAKYVIVVMSGPQVGERTTVDGPVRLGRDPASDLPLRDASVSWSHARIWRDDGALFLEDQGSRHGTLLNGVRTEGRTPLAEGDDLEVGGTRLRVELHGPAELHFDRAVADRLLHDDLTGLLSRRRFELELELSLEAAAKDRTSLALIVLDLDGLKRVNDAHGHAAGAQVISVVGTHLRGLASDASARGCRFGGDEFAVFVALGEADAARLAGEWLGAIASIAVPWGETSLSVAASGGVASPAGEPTTVTELFARADQALLSAKRSGGGRVVRWTQLPRGS